MQLHYSRTSNINDNKRLYEQVKDLHLGEWLLSQTPAEELDEIKFTTECSISLGALLMQIKKQFGWQIGGSRLFELKFKNFRFLCSSRSHKRSKLTSMANVALHFAHLMILCLKISWKLGYF